MKKQTYRNYKIVTESEKKGHSLNDKKTEKMSYHEKRTHVNAILKYKKQP